MSALDWIVVAVLALSVVLAFFRGVVRELIALSAWVLGFIAAVAFTPALAAKLPDLGGGAAVPYVLAFIVIIIAALLLGSLIAWPLAKAIRVAGLGFVDRFLGGAFGLARGVLLVLALVLVAGLTSLPRTDWWHNSALAPALAAGALSLKRWLPAAWAEQLDYSRDGRTPVRKAVPARREV